MRNLRAAICWLALGLAPAAVAAQGTSVAFGAITADPTLPVEVTADTLDVSQADGTAEFVGNVIAVQGEMRLSADRVLVIYREEVGGIERLEARGDVVLVNGPDAAEAAFAEYSIDTGVVEMTGDVLLTQGDNALTSQKMIVNLTTGTATMSGRVRTILRTTEP